MVSEFDENQNILTKFSKNQILNFVKIHLMEVSVLR